MSKPIVAIATFPMHEAEKVAKALVEPHLAACVSVLPAMQSYYWWKGEMLSDTGVMLVIKTTDDQLDAVRASLRKTSDEEVYELLVLDVTDGNPDYLSWLQHEVRPSR